MKNFLATALLFFTVVQTQAQTNVQSIGALGNGIADDTAALLKALRDGKSDLYFPKGTYRLTQTLEFDLAKLGHSSVSGDGTATLLMEGPGPALRFRGTHGGTAAPATVKAQVWEIERTPMASGIEIVGKHPEADGIEADGTMQLTLTRVTVREARHSVHLVRRNRNVLLADCHFYHNTGVGVFLDAVNLHQINITNCHISYNGGGGVVSKGGQVRNLQIGSSDIESNHSADGPPTANVWLDSTGGSIAEVAITGCTLQHTHKAPNSANIRIQGAGKDAGVESRTGQAATNEGHVTIGNNVFSDVQVNIEIQNARGVTITGNTFWEGFQHDLLIEHSSHIVVSGNNFDRNPRYIVNGSQGAEHNGLIFRHCSETTLNANTISGALENVAALEVSDSRRMIISNNSILDSDGAGLFLKNVSDSLITSNLIRDDRSPGTGTRGNGLRVEEGTGNVLGTNLVKDR
jgi:Periplasmic copper-binding protein (NosD)/Pectate lyase superfamily protein